MVLHLHIFDYIFTGVIVYNNFFGWCFKTDKIVNPDGKVNYSPNNAMIFSAANLNRTQVRILYKRCLHYYDLPSGDWPWCKTKEDVCIILTYLVSLNTPSSFRDLYKYLPIIEQINKE